MIGIAAKHKQRVLDALEKQTKEAKNTDSTVDKPPSSPNHVSKSLSSDVAFNELQRDLERLKEIADIPEKIAYKREALLPKYSTLIAKSRQSGTAIHSDIVVYTLIWLIDAEDIETALGLADFAIDNNMSMPDRFKRDLPTYITEEIFNWADRQYKDNASAAPYFDTVIDRVESGVWPVDHFIVLNKIYKLKALFAERDNDWSTAITYFEKCVDVNPTGHGVKTKLNNARSKLPSPPTTQTNVMSDG